MYRLMFLALSLSVSGMGAASYLANNQDKFLDVPQASPAYQPEDKLVSKQNIRLSGVERIKRSANGHFEGDFRLNHLTLHGVIDTGASTIALNKTAARRAGIRLSDRDFIYEVTTANGKAKAARATISRVTFGSIRMADVDALVLEDKALNTVLIGMSFLNRLRGFEYKSGDLILRR